MKFLILPLTLLTLSAYANNHRDKGHFKKMMKELDLTKDQIEKLKAHRKEHRKDGKRKSGEMRELRKEMKEAFINGSESRMKELHQKLIAERSVRQDKRFEKMVFLKNLLTKEQREKYIEMKQRMRKRWRKHDSEEDDD